MLKNASDQLEKDIKSINEIKDVNKETIDNINNELKQIKNEYDKLKDVNKELKNENDFMKKKNPDLFKRKPVGMVDNHTLMEKIDKEYYYVKLKYENQYELYIYDDKIASYTINGSFKDFFDIDFVDYISIPHRITPAKVIKSGKVYTLVNKGNIQIRGE